MQEIAWGVVTSTSPVEVRFAGDTTDTPIEWKTSGLTLALTNRVLLARAGTNDGWMIVAIVAAT